MQVSATLCGYIMWLEGSGVGSWTQRAGEGEVGGAKSVEEGKVRRLFRIHKQAHRSL